MFDVKSIKSDFPILSQQVYGRELHYLDSAATSQKPQCVIDAIERLYVESNSNVHRGVHYLAEEMTSLYEGARSTVRKYIGAKYDEEIIFTSGATMALNLVARSWCDANLREGDNIVVSEMEHHSNIVPWQMAAERNGATLRVLPFDERGELMLDALDEVLDERTRLVAVTQVSNVLGTVNNLTKIIEAAHRIGAVVVVDGCQGIVHESIDVVATDCDFYAFSGHKIYAPTGIGVLYGKRALLESMPPFMGGGDMVAKVTFERTTYAPLPLKFEAGTQNYVGAAALAQALDYVASLPMAEIRQYHDKLVERANRGLLTVDGVQLYGLQQHKAPIISFNVEGCNHYDLGVLLDRQGVAVRTGHHCAEPTVSHFGVTGMCRASMGVYTTEEDIDALVAAVQRAVKMLRR